MQNFNSSLITGIITSILFHPYDRALFLSVSNNRPFLKAENFINPFHGIKYSIGHRLVSNSGYFILQSNFTNGLVIGGLNGCISHLMSAVKMKVWANNNQKNIFKAIHYSIGRDAIFSLIYEKYRNDHFLNNLFVAGLATAIVSPLNYIKVKAITGEKVEFNSKTRLGIGFGTIRVGLGMAVSQFIFDYLNLYFKK